MTILPIVERELRVAARRRATYSTRTVVALVAILVGMVVMFINLGKSPAMLGGYIFVGLSVCAMLYCLLAGRLSTADCLSEEKREGTLGLLFLTDLTGCDVVLGKLAATSVNSFYGLLAIMPVLAIPLLLGGVTNAQFWLMVLVLVNTFLFSLAVGMFCSAISRDVRKAMGFNLSLMFFFTLILPGIAALIAVNTPSHVFIHELCFTSPGYAFVICTARLFAGPVTITSAAAAGFWESLALIHGLTWLFLFLAAWIVPRSWQDRDASPVRSPKTRWRDLWHAWSYGPVAQRASFRKRLLDQNAFYWLSARARFKPLHVWTLFGLGAIWWAAVACSSGALWLDQTVNLAFAIMLNSALKLWIALEAGQRLAEDQKIGSLELVLSTPLTERDIMRGQWLALRRQFFAPVLLAIVLELILMRATATHNGRSAAMTYAVWLAGITMFPADIAALIWVSMAASLKAKSFNRAISETVFRVLLLPWIGYGLVVVTLEFYHLLLWGSWSPEWQFYLGWWFKLGLVTDLYFGLRAYSQLHNHLRELATQRFGHNSAANSKPTP